MLRETPASTPFRQTVYPVTPTLSLEGLQLRLTCVGLLAVAARFAGAVGGVVSGVVAVSEQSSTSKVAPPLLVFVLKMEKGRMSPFLTVV